MRALVKTDPLATIPFGNDAARVLLLPTNENWAVLLIVVWPSCQ